MSSRWLPLDSVLVRYVDDPDLYHHRIVLRGLEGDRAVVVTPDRETFVTSLAVGETYDDLKRMHNGRLPGGPTEEDTYLAKHSEQGVFSREELLQLVHQAEEEGVPRPRRRQLGKLGEDGLRHPAPVPRVASRKPEIAEAPDLVWLVLYSSTGDQSGDQVDPPAEAETIKLGGTDYKLFSKGGAVVLARGVTSEAAPHVSELLKGALVTENHKGDDKDVRVLPVMYDTAEERWRTLAEAMPEIEEVDFDDFPLSGPRTICRDLKQLRRLGFDWVQHHESWIRKSGVRVSDRSVHEHSSICRVLNFMLCYDQLNLGALASAEALNRRRSLIEVAHQGRPEAPSYEGAEEILGIRESSDGSVIDPALTQHAAKRQAARAEVLKQNRLAAEEKRHLRPGPPDKPEKPDKGGKSGGKGGEKNSGNAP